MKRYISAKPETRPMFDSRFLDFFSRVHWFVPLMVYVPIVIVLGGIAIWRYDVAPEWFAACWLCGLLTWSFTEYVLHRFFFHYHPSSQIGKKFFWIIHGVHHDYPSDPLRLVFPPVASLPLAALFYGLFYVIIGARYAPAVMSGFLTGYLIYDMCHYAIHHLSIKNAFWKRLKKHHMRHHFDDPESGFGVSSAFWDGIFGTDFKKQKNPSTAVAPDKKQ